MQEAVETRVNDDASKKTHHERCELSMQKRLDRLERMIAVLQKRHCTDRGQRSTKADEKTSPSPTMECDRPLPSIESDEADDGTYDRMSLEKRSLKGSG